MKTKEDGVEEANGGDRQSSETSEVVKDTDDNLYVDPWTKFVFMVFGLGPSWMAVSASFQELPYFEKTQPETVCLAAFISLAVSTGVLFVGFNYIFMRFCNDNKPLAHRYAVPFVLILDVFALFFIAITWRYTIANMSIPLFIGTWFGGGVGGLTQVMVMPFIALYKSDCLSAFRIGMDGGNLLCAAVAAIQRPGSPVSLFGPTVYYCIFGVLILSSVVSYRYILATGLGLANKVGAEGEGAGNDGESKDKVIVVGEDGDSIEAGDSGNRSKSMTREVSVDSLVEMPPRQDALANSPARERGGGKDDLGDEIPNPLQEAQDHGTDIEQPPTNHKQKQPTQAGAKEGGNKREIAMRTNQVDGAWGTWGAMVLGAAGQIDNFTLRIETHIMDTIFGWICSCFPEGMKTRGWFRITLPYMLCIFYMDMNNFGLAPALFPIALLNSTGNLTAQENILQLAYQVSAPMMYIGDFLTFYVDMPLRYPVALYFSVTVSIYIFASMKPSIDSWSDASRFTLSMYLATSFCIGQAVSGYILIMAWRKASIEPPPQHREESSRWCGYADQISSFVGSVAALPIVLTSGSSCVG
jgi:hypothetical protein